MKQLYVKNKRGISLVMLIITVIVAVILISAVLLSLDKNDPRKGASENVFKSDFRTLQEELAIKKTEIKNQDSKANINVNVSYDDEEELKKWVGSIDKSILNGIVGVCNGDLVFIDNGMSDEEKKWAKDIAKVVDSCEDYTPKRGGYYFKAKTLDGENVENYTWTNKDVKVSVDDEYAGTLKEKYDSFIYSIDSASYENYSSPFKISTLDGTTKISKIKGVAKSSSDSTLEPLDFIEDFVVKIDKIEPTAPDIIINNSDSALKMTLSGEKDEDSGINSIYYSVDKSTWKKYDAVVVLDDSVTQVWTKSRDNAGNETDESNYGYAKVKSDVNVNLNVTSPSTNIYKEGTLIKIEATFSGGKPSTTPTLNINFGGGTTRTAKAVSSMSNKIVYNYTVQSGDNGKLAIVGKYYERDVELGGNEITADTTNPALSFVSAKYNGVVGNSAVISDSGDKITIEFKANDLNINTSYLKAEDIELMLNGKTNTSLKKTLTDEKSGSYINFSLTLTGFTTEAGKISIKIPSRKVNDKALNDYNWNDEKIIETNYTVETKLDKESPKITSVEMTSNNTTGGEKYAKNGDTISLKVKFSENLGTVPTIQIAGRAATLVDSATKASEYTAKITIPSGEVNLEEGYLGYSISGYKDLTNNIGETVSKNTTLTKPSDMTDTVVYDRTNPSADAIFKYYKMGGKTEITDLSLTNGYAYMAKLNKFLVSDSLSGINTKQYQWSNSETADDNNWVNITSNTISEKTSTGTYYLHLRAIDNSGNVYEAYKEIKIDRTSPVAPKVVATSGTEGKNGWYTTDVEIGLSTTPTDEHSGIASYSLSKTKLTSSGSVNVVVTDNVGNVSENSNVFYIDKTKPTVVLNITPYKADGKTEINLSTSNGYCYTAKIDEPTITENGSGLDEIKYKWDSGDWTIWNDNNLPTVPTTNGEYILHVEVTDKAGNYSAVSSNIKIDRTAPSITVNITDINSKNINISKTNENFKYTEFGTTSNNWVNKANGGLKNTVSVSDNNGSGFDKTVFSYNKVGEFSSFSTTISGNETETSASFTRDVTGNGKRYYTFTSYDKVGNKRTVEVYAQIDQSPPTAEPNITYKNKSGNVISNLKTTNGYCYSAVINNSTVTEVGSGLLKREYKLNSGGSWSTTEPTVPTTTGENTLYVRATDKAGNVSDTTLASARASLNIDRMPPNFGYTETSSISKQTRTISLVGCNDVYGEGNNKKIRSGIAGYKYYNASKVQTENNNGIRVVESSIKYNSPDMTTKTSHTYSTDKGILYCLKFEAIDKVGNSSYKLISRYGPCDHKIGNYINHIKGTKYTNYKVERYYFEGDWKCSAGDSHTAKYTSNALLTRCINCGVPIAYLKKIGGETGLTLFTLWHPDSRYM